MTRYQVVGECAHVVVADHSGVSAMTLLYKGAYMPDGVDPKRLEHLISSGLVAEVTGEPIAPNAAVDQDPAVGIPTGSEVSTDDGVHPPVLTDEQHAAQREQIEANAEVEQKRAAARAKLAELGGVPDGRAANAVLVEFLAGKGYDRAEVEKADRPELQKLAAEQK